MVWLIFAALAVAAYILTEIAADWLHACRKMMAPWRDERPQSGLWGVVSTPRSLACLAFAAVWLGLAVWGLGR